MRRLALGCAASVLGNSYGHGIRSAVPQSTPATCAPQSKTRRRVSVCGTRRGTPCVKFLIAYRLCAGSMLSASGDSASSMECAFRLGFVAPSKCARARGPFRSQAHGAPEELSPSARRPGISSRRERSLGDKGLHHIILIVEGFLSKTFNMKSSG